MPKTFIVGDVHGCFTELQWLIELAGVSLSRHRLMLVGDVINKGPYSFAALKWVRDQGIPVVIGNHEMRFIDGVRTGKSMSPQLKELADQMGAQKQEWVDWIDSWPNFIEDEFILVHGGLVPGEHPSQTERQYLTTMRTWTGKKTTQFIQEAPPWHDFYTGDKFVYYGHFAAQGIHRTVNTLCLDTGCVYGRLLSGTWHGDSEILAIPAKETYCQISY